MPHEKSQTLKLPSLPHLFVFMALAAFLYYGFRVLLVLILQSVFVLNQSEIASHYGYFVMAFPAARFISGFVADAFSFL
jgi:dipeptide/tripeptide permease